MELTLEQELELRDAKERAGSFLGATKVAAFNGWSIGFFAVVSILFGLFSPTSFSVGAVPVVKTRNEFVGRARLRSLEPSGLELLWRNQLGFLSLIIAYCVWSIYRIVAAPAPPIIADLTELLGVGVEDLFQSVTLTLYAVVIAATGIFQGLNARYYFVRVSMIRDYVRDTPQWVLDLQRATVME